MVIDLPWPPSVNRYWRSVKGRVLISREGREYRSTVAAMCASRPSLGDARLEVCIFACPPDRRRRDLDNVLKALLDAMQHAGVYDDDSQIDRLRIERHQPGEGVVKVRLSPLSRDQL